MAVSSSADDASRSPVHSTESVAWAGLESAARPLPSPSECRTRSRPPSARLSPVTPTKLPFVLLGDVGTAAGLTNLVLLFVFVAVNTALLRLRFTEPDHDGFRAPLSFGRLSLTALGGLLTSLALIVVYAAGWL